MREQQNNRHDRTPRDDLLRGHCSRSHDAVIRVYGDAGNAIETVEQTGDFKEW
jgi:hypothetical protein